MGHVWGSVVWGAVQQGLASGTVGNKVGNEEKKAMEDEPGVVAVGRAGRTGFLAFAVLGGYDGLQILAFAAFLASIAVLRGSLRDLLCFVDGGLFDICSTVHSAAEGHISRAASKRR